MHYEGVSALKGTFSCLLECFMPGALHVYLATAGLALCLSVSVFVLDSFGLSSPTWATSTRAISRKLRALTYRLLAVVAAGSTMHESVNQFTSSG